MSFLQAVTVGRIITGVHVRLSGEIVYDFFFLLFSLQAVSNSSPSHGLQHARRPCPSPSPGVCSNSCPSSQWCHPTISSFVSHLLLLRLIFPGIRVFSRVSSSHQVVNNIQLHVCVLHIYITCITYNCSRYDDICSSVYICI